MKAQQSRTVNLTYTSIVAFFGLLSFLVGPSAYTWGEQDMMPFLERSFNPEFLTNDFFTNASLSKSPRWIYGYFIASLSWISNIHWYKVLFVLKLMLSIIKPVLFYQVLVLIVRRYVDKTKIGKLSLIILICAILMIFTELKYYLYVAGWYNYDNPIHAYNLSIALSLFAIMLKERKTNGFPYYLVLIFIATLMHPSMSLFLIAFYLIFLIPFVKNEYKNMIKITSIWVITVLMIKLFFSSSTNLSALEFIQYYVLERHPHHYHVPSFMHRNGTWTYYFILIIALFCVPLVYSIIKNKKRLRTAAFFALLCYSCSIFFQYFFIDIFPVKLIAYIGPSRFTTFGYWMLVVLWSIMISDFINGTTVNFPSLGLRKFAIIISSLFLTGLIYLDNPNEDRYLKRKDYYDFISKTPKNAVFQTYSSQLAVDLRIVGNRAVMIGKEFPFTEKYIKEYFERHSLIWGTSKSKNKDVKFYRNLKPEDFRRISKKFQLDYIIVEDKFSKQFRDIKPVWNNSNIRIYKVNDF